MLRSLGVALTALACSTMPPAKDAAAKPGKAAPHPVKRPVTRIGADSADRVVKRWEVAAGGYARAVALSPRHGRVAFANKDTVALFDLATGKRLGESGRCKDVVHTGLAFVGEKLIAVCETGLVAYGAKKLETAAAPETHASRVTAAAFAGARVALGHRDGVIRILDLAGSAPIEIAVPGPPIDVKSLALTHDGQRVAVAWVQGSVWWWDVAQPNAPHDLVRHESESDALAFSPDGSVLAEEGEKQQTTLWRFDSPPKVTARVKNGAWVKQILFTPDGKWLIRGGSDGLELAEIAGPRRVALDTRGNVEDVALDASAALLAAADRDGRLTLWGVGR